MRADAEKNYQRIIEVARDVVTENGIHASLRDIARRANLGMATLLRHFPTREALFEALLCTRAEDLIQKAHDLEKSLPADDALLAWFREGVIFTHSYNGVCDLMASAHADPNSALHASSIALRTVGGRLLRRAQTEGTARPDMDGVDLFALISAMGWMVGQPSFTPRAENLYHIIASAILTNQPDNGVDKHDTDNEPGSAFLR
ncbi:TetR/AcrR family transcriptional regulator [Candidatus Sodalis endolongispinus]|uniref:TetR/AcrR family transcriptional regulator n=1 Tax=Candidatus Sodalis endolongispinus TaxID=2812662 RepID=A0ABS5YI77_9GAMM|nr:TetR/AcrR family transcriptional regulator [Candidatus Sodalis endolongispinus]MBT9433406.1 TetR/AcrR family transcriptional regulator [Candidatus Sodalis endolongispinus]